MASRNAVCIVVDGLRASALGAYGNAWHATPALDRLASQSVVWEWMWATPHRDDAFGIDWRPAPTEPGGILPADAIPPIRATCITDDVAVAQRWSLVASVDHVIVEDQAPAAAGATWTNAFTRLFALAADHLPSWRQKTRDRPHEAHVMWIHAQGMHGLWDAPLAYRQRLCDEDDPPPPTWNAPPDWIETADPDELLGYRVAYAAQVMLLDECLDAFLTALDETFVEDSVEAPIMTVVAGLRGFALGEHGRVGKRVDDLYSESLHVPCLMRIGARNAGERWRGLSQLDDLRRSLVGWLSMTAKAPARQAPRRRSDEQGPADSDAHRDSDRNQQPASQTADSGADDPDRASLVELLGPQREFIVARNQAGERAVRTDHWMLVDKRLSQTGLAPSPPSTGDGEGVMASDAKLDPMASAADGPLPEGQGGAGQPIQLFVKPDDRWEVNEVASRCPDAVEAMLARLGESSRA